MKHINFGEDDCFMRVMRQVANGFISAPFAVLLSLLVYAFYCNYF